jgi:hypothetical protein
VKIEVSAFEITIQIGAMAAVCRSIVHVYVCFVHCISLLLIDLLFSVLYFLI